jgi:hypothetical protein
VKQRRGVDTAAAFVGEAAGVLRRRRLSRRDRVRLYEADGSVITLPPDSEQAESLRADAEAMIDAVDASTSPRA